MFTRLFCRGGNAWLLGLATAFLLTALSPGVANAGAIGNFVWEDLNSDGIQDPGEPGIAGVVPTLTDDLGNFLSSVVTNGVGLYAFQSLDPGSYVVTVDESSVPAGLMPTVPNATGHARDSNVSPASVELMYFDYSVDFGYVSCAECEGGVTELTLQYNGAGPALVTVNGKKNDVLFNAFLEPGDVFTIFGAENDGTFGKEIKIGIDCIETTKIKTDCKNPIGPGQVEGDFEVIAATSLDGGTVCPVGAGGVSQCEDGKAQAIVMQYTAKSCSESSNSQDPSKTSCDDFLSLGTDDVFIVASDKDDLNDSKAKIWFEGIVELGEKFTIDALAEGEDKLKSSTHVFVFSADGLDLLQQIEFHTSCSQPLNFGDTFGSVKLVHFVPEQ